MKPGLAESTRKKKSPMKMLTKSNKPNEEGNDQNRESTNTTN